MQLFGGGEKFAKRKDVTNPNLMQDTAQFSKLNDRNFWINQSGTLSNLFDSLGNKVLVFNSSWVGVISSRHVNKGEIYTLSWNVKTSNPNIKTFVYANDKKYSPDQCEVNFLNYFYDGKAITPPDPHTVNSWVSQGDTSEHRVGASFLVTHSGILGVRPESINADAPYYISSFKLEKGGLPTPWCPAYADYAMKSDIQNLNNLLGPVLPSNIKQLGKTDLNNLPSGWCVVTDSTSSNLPDGVYSWCICFTLYVAGTGQDRFQIAIAYNMDTCNIYVRTCSGNPAQWLQWKKISYSA